MILQSLSLDISRFFIITTSFKLYLKKFLATLPASYTKLQKLQICGQLHLPKAACLQVFYLTSYAAAFPRLAALVAASRQKKTRMQRVCNGVFTPAQSRVLADCCKACCMLASASSAVLQSSLKCANTSCCKCGRWHSARSAEAWALLRCP